MKARGHKGTSLFIATLVTIAFSIIFPGISQAIEETEGAITQPIKVYYDGSGFCFYLNVASPCGEVGYFVPRTIANYTEVFVAVMKARENTENVVVATSGCWSVNPCFSKVLGITIGAQP